MYWVLSNISNGVKENTLFLWMSGILFNSTMKCTQAPSLLNFTRRSPHTKTNNKAGLALCVRENRFFSTPKRRFYLRFNIMLVFPDRYSAAV